MAYNAGKNLTPLYVKEKKKSPQLREKKILTKLPIHHPPPPLRPEKVNLYTESVFLLASVMVKINSVKSWWSKGLHLPSAGLLVQTRKKFKETEKKKFTIHDSVVCDKALFFLKKKSKF